MALLYEPESFQEPIIVNRFDNYFAPISFWGATISWLEKQCQVKYVRSAPGAISTLEGIRILGLGTINPGITIPGNLTKATYMLMFKILPEERIIEDRRTDLFWYGQGFQYASGWGITKYPLFRVWLDSRDNHLYIWFGGGRQVEWGGGGYKDTYPFHEWKVDLGHVDNYQKYSPFIILLNLETKAFAKIIVGSKDIPFPQGYTEIAPQYYQEALTGGMQIGSSSAITDATILIDDVEVYPEYHIPFVGLCLAQKVATGIGFASAVIIPIGYGIKQTRRR